MTDNLIPVMDWEEQAAAAAGLTVSLLRFTVAFFLSVPINILFRYIPTIKGRHLYSFVTGLLLIYYPFGNACLHVLVPGACTYLVMRRMRQHCGTLSWLVTFPYLIMCHAFNASGLTWKEGVVDFTGAQMVLTLKVIAIAVAHQDGLKPAEALRSYPASKRLSSCPSLLEYLSYLMAAGNLLAGPFFEFADFKAYVERTGDWAEAPSTPPSCAPPFSPASRRRRLPQPWVSGGLRLAKGILYMALYQRLGFVYGPAMLETGWYLGQPLWYRVLLIMVVGTIYRFKYYFAWAVAESGLIFSGLCFNGFEEDGRPRWNRYINARIRRIETCTSAAKLAAEWNICTGNWLRHYVYDRLTAPGRKPTFTTLLGTQLVSGVWHGLYPGYALFFSGLAFFFESSRILYRYEASLLPKWFGRFPPWVALKWAYTMFTLNYLASAFMVLTLWETLSIWQSVSYAGHGAMAVILFFGWTLPPPRKKRGSKSKAGEGSSGSTIANGDGAAPQRDAALVGEDAISLKQE